MHLRAARPAVTPSRPAACAAQLKQEQQQRQSSPPPPPPSSSSSPASSPASAPPRRVRDTGQPLLLPVRSAHGRCPAPPPRAPRAELARCVAAARLSTKDPEEDFNIRTARRAARAVYTDRSSSVSAKAQLRKLPGSRDTTHRRTGIPAVRQPPGLSESACWTVAIQAAAAPRGMSSRRRNLFPSVCADTVLTPSNLQCTHLSRHGGARRGSMEEGRRCGERTPPKTSTN